MQSVIWFLILSSLIGGIGTVYEPPDGHYEMAVDAEQKVVLDTWIKPGEVLQKKHLVSQQFDYSCGSAALATLLNYHLGERFTERQVIQGLFAYGNLTRIRQRRAFSFLDMKRFVDAMGYHGAGYTAELENLKDLDVPVILPITVNNYEHFVVFRGIHENRVFLADPWLGHTTYPVGVFEKELWTRPVLFMVDPKERQTRSLMALTEEDMRYIDEDEVMLTLFPSLNLHEDFWEKREFIRHLEPDQHIYQR